LSEFYDHVVVGGGMGGSTLAKSMAEHGVRVLILKRGRELKDCVRGEYIFP
jgi:choline dehydrogenase-like flavoprotein